MAGQFDANRIMRPVPNCSAYRYFPKCNEVRLVKLTNMNGKPMPNHSYYLRYLDNFTMGPFRMYVLYDVADGHIYYLDSMFIRPKK